MDIQNISIEPQNGNKGTHEISFKLTQENNSIDKVIEVEAISGDKSSILTIIHEGKREIFKVKEGELRLSDGRTLNVLKEKYKPNK